LKSASLRINLLVAIEDEGGGREDEEVPDEVGHHCSREQQPQPIHLPYVAQNCFRTQ